MSQDMCTHPMFYFWLKTTPIYIIYNKHQQKCCNVLCLSGKCQSSSLHHLHPGWTTNSWLSNWLTHVVPDMFCAPPICWSMRGSMALCIFCMTWHQRPQCHKHNSWSPQPRLSRVPAELSKLSTCHPEKGHNSTIFSELAAKLQPGLCQRVRFCPFCPPSSPSVCTHPSADSPGQFVGLLVSASQWCFWPLGWRPRLLWRCATFGHRSWDVSPWNFVKNGASARSFAAGNLDGKASTEWSTSGSCTSQSSSVSVLGTENTSEIFANLKCIEYHRVILKVRSQSHLNDSDHTFAAFQPCHETKNKTKTNENCAPRMLSMMTSAMVPGSGNRKWHLSSGWDHKPLDSFDALLFCTWCRQQNKQFTCQRKSMACWHDVGHTWNHLHELIHGPHP